MRDLARLLMHKVWGAGGRAGDQDSGLHVPLQGAAENGSSGLYSFTLLRETLATFHSPPPGGGGGGAREAIIALWKQETWQTMPALHESVYPQHVEATLLRLTLQHSQL